MPEGDTVWLTAHVLHQALAGETLTRGELRVPAYATAPLAGLTVDEVTARGKHLLTRFDDGTTLHTHLGMEGTWRVGAAGEPWRGGPAHQLRAILVTPRTRALGYRLPLVELLPTEAESRAIGHLGPDLLAAGWSPAVEGAESVRRLLTRPSRPIGEALLDQRNLAGVGNLYKSEICFLRGLWPWTPVEAVREPLAVVTLAHRLLLANRDRWEQVTTGDLRRGRQTWVYRRARQTCRRCGAAIRQASGRPPGAVGSGPTPPEPAARDASSEPEIDRITFWCPHCQPAPATTPG